MIPLSFDKVPLFNGLLPADQEKLTQNFQVVEVPAQTILFCEGEAAEYLYIILQGRLDILKALGTREERLLATRTAGEFIGELGLVNPDGRRMASARSREQTQVWQIRYQDFEALLFDNPRIAVEMVRVLSGRLTMAHNLTIQELQEKNTQLQRAYDELKAAQAELVEKEKLERELEVAREIQMSLLPQKLPALAGFEFGAMMRPAQAVGGDFYDVFPLGEGQVGVIIGDVADKGIPAAIFMAQVHALIYAEAVRKVSPGEVLQKVNALMQEMNASGQFVTVVYGFVDAKAGTFNYARAGHELPFLLHPDGQVVPLPLGQGQPLGFFDTPILDLQTFPLHPGETLLLYTDGVKDERNEQGALFGAEGTLEALKSAVGLSASEVCRHLWARLEQFRQNTDQDDDITFVAIRAV